MTPSFFLRLYPPLNCFSFPEIGVSTLPHVKIVPFSQLPRIVRVLFRADPQASHPDLSLLESRLRRDIF